MIFAVRLVQLFRAKVQQRHGQNRGEALNYFLWTSLLCGPT